MTMQPSEMSTLFKTLHCLELHDQPEMAYENRQVVFEQLSALKSLRSLVVPWHPSYSNFSVFQVPYHRCPIPVGRRAGLRLGMIARAGLKQSSRMIAVCLDTLHKSILLHHSRPKVLWDNLGRKETADGWRGDGFLKWRPAAKFILQNKPGKGHFKGR